MCLALEEVWGGVVGNGTEGAQRVEEEAAGAEAGGVGGMTAMGTQAWTYRPFGVWGLGLALYALNPKP